MSCDDYAATPLEVGAGLRQAQRAFTLTGIVAADLVRPGPKDGVPITSYQGRSLTLLTITPSHRLSRRLMGAGHGEVTDVFLLAGMHAREWITTASVLCMLQSRAEEIARLLVKNQLRLVVLPLLNPDGYLFSRKVYRHQRKTRSKHPIMHPYTGVDLNRNFGIENVSWGFGNPTGYKSELYQGPEPFSEPEAKAVRWVVDEFLYERAVVLDVHCCAKVVFATANCSEQIAEVGNQIALAAPPLEYRERSRIYDAHNTGVAVDWMASRPNVLGAFMLEIAGKHDPSDFKDLFKNPKSDIAPQSRVLFNALARTGEIFSTLTPRLVSKFDAPADIAVKWSEEGSKDSEPGVSQSLQTKYLREKQELRESESDQEQGTQGTTISQSNDKASTLSLEFIVEELDAKSVTDSEARAMDLVSAEIQTDEHVNDRAWALFLCQFLLIICFLVAQYLKIARRNRGKRGP
mmetsp:Transcript_3828/g.7406  ORF Transcript_3828/g.7406 Transcript_3828/m.7406 type:complete len:462 (+) Transcript_3828:119-1504(+)